VSASPTPNIPYGDDDEAVRVKMSVAFMVAGAVEVQARLSRDLDPELYKLLNAAHGQALHVMCRERMKLRDARRAAHDRARAEVSA
jgi:hypothetical protein